MMLTLKKQCTRAEVMAFLPEVGLVHVSPRPGRSARPKPLHSTADRIRTAYDPTGWLNSVCRQTSEQRPTGEGCRREPQHAPHDADWVRRSKLARLTPG